MPANLNEAPCVTQKRISFSELMKDVAAADRLNVKPKTLANWRCLGTGPRFVKIGKLVMYRPEDIEAYISGQVRRSTSDTGYSD